ncbi:hypothetical protein L798_01438 [Zootermopsis nevadensis]|uniref:Uncharacterized protein n=1 Tax=Zootermopsis nevadensis TaxID=136037 RepID=A0A067RHC0_ZOONE|nr:hypothetical protein L798_01438 [Zootermopsis nevadensis]
MILVVTLFHLIQGHEEMTEAAASAAADEIKVVAGHDESSEIAYLLAL